MAALRAHIDVAARQRQREAFERTLAGIVEEDRPALLEIAGADGDDTGRIDAAEHRLSGDRDRLDQRLAGIARQDELRALTLRRGPGDRKSVGTEKSVSRPVDLGGRRIKKKK